jgi:PGF-CTERM protein
MKYSNILISMTVLAFLAVQACAQSDPLGESSSSSTIGSSGDYLSPNMGKGAGSSNPDEGVSGMVQWLDEPVTKDVAKSAKTATSTTASPDAAKSTATSTSSAPDRDATESTTTTTSTTHAAEPSSTTKSTSTTTSTPGFEAAFAVAGLLAVTFIALRRRC